jgi:SAM domain (Sterile alpha motif)
MKGIAEWLASIGLSEYARCFADNAIDLSVVCDLTEQDLKDPSPQDSARNRGA